MSFVLRWFNREGLTHYGRAVVGEYQMFDFVRDQREATRFETRVQAYQAADPSVYFGAGGPEDDIGWKVVRLVKKRPKTETASIKVGDVVTWRALAVSVRSTASPGI